VNFCSSVVMWSKPKMLTGLDQKVCGKDGRVWLSPIVDIKPPAYRKGPTHSETIAKQGKPVVSPITAGAMQRTLLMLRAKEDGESQCQAVMAWIPASCRARKRAHFRLVLLGERS
jgi:hypothetical protein